MRTYTVLSLSRTNLPHWAGGLTQRAIVLPLSQTNLPHWVGGYTQTAIVLPLSQTNLPHRVGGRVARGGLGISSGARWRRVNRCPPETQERKNRSQANKQTVWLKTQKQKNKSRGFYSMVRAKSSGEDPRASGDLVSNFSHPWVNITKQHTITIGPESKPLPFRNQNVMADSNHDPSD